MNVKTLICGHPVASYFLLAYAIPWLGSMAAVGPKFLRGEEILLVDGLLMFVLMLAGPSIAGATMTTIVDGRAGRHDLWTRMRRWQVGAYWYATLLIPPALILAVLLTLSSLVSPAFTPSFLAQGLLLGLLTGFFEEIGWTGYAFPKMRLSHSALAASIYLAILHTTWHIMADFLATSQADGMLWLPHFLTWLVVPMLAMRVLISWIYCNTGSVLLAQLMHASSTGFLIALSPAPATALTEIYWYAPYAVLLWIVAAVVIVVYGKQLVRHPHSGLTLPHDDRHLPAAW